MRRRQVLGSVPLLFVGARPACARALHQQSPPGGPDLPEELSTEELALVNQSSMAKDLGNFLGKGYS